MDKNLEEVVDKAAKTGEKVVSVECPCCGKSFYATVDEATFSVINRKTDDFDLDLKALSGKILGRKCPYCGFSCSLSPSDFLDLGRVK